MTVKTLPCFACGRGVEWPPSRCPYCKTEQLERPCELPRRLWARIILAVALGLFAGLAAATIRPPEFYFSRRLASLSRHSAKADGTRARIRDLAESLPSGFRIRRPQDVIQQRVVAGEKIALLGILQHADIHAEHGEIQLVAKWATAETVTVGVARLSLSDKKALLRAQFPPQVVVALGSLEGGRLEATRAEPLGEMENNELAWFLP